MSYKQLTPAWEANLPCPSKLVLISLADQANDDGVCWPSISTLTKRTGLDERSIYRHLATLEKLGHLHREARPGRSNVYHIHPVATPDKNVTTSTPDNFVTPDTQSPPPLTESHPTPDRESPITVIEPKEEPSTPHNPPRGFAEFWSAYPKKIGKGAAEKAWSKAKINGHMPDVMSALETQKRSDQWSKDGGQYIPNPATWINQKRWEDQLDGPSAAQRDWI